MQTFKKFYILTRNLTTKRKVSVIPDEKIINSIENNEYKARKQPGINYPKTINLPENFTKAVVKTLQDEPVKTLVTDSEKLRRILKCRHAPIEYDEFKLKCEQVQNRILSKFEEEEEQQQQQQVTRQILKDKSLNILKKEIYNWKPIKYDKYNSLLYLIGRFAAEYAVLYKILSEIKRRDETFKPNSLFDFGSGINTATWSFINLFNKNELFEVYNVDISRDMNDLASSLLNNGNEWKEGIFHRQFLPATNRIYDIVICSYTLFELPDKKTRLQTALNLWNKTGKYLIFVEQGTNAGFKLINEIREYILSLKGHVHMPCPHDEICPRAASSDDSTPCNFQVFYFDLPFNGGRKSELYSYVVLSKFKNNQDRQPRLVRPTLVRPRHAICRMCTEEGELQEIIFTKYKHGKTLYHCAKHSDWGDRLPIKVVK